MTPSIHPNRRRFLKAGVSVGAVLIPVPVIVPIPGNTKQAHLQENLWSADFEFSPEELKSFTETVSKIKTVGARYTGTQAQQTNK